MKFQLPFKKKKKKKRARQSGGSCWLFEYIIFAVAPSPPRSWWLLYTCLCCARPGVNPRVKSGRFMKLLPDYEHMDYRDVYTHCMYMSLRVADLSMRGLCVCVCVCVSKFCFMDFICKPTVAAVFMHPVNNSPQHCLLSY